ncbi:MAG: universal stress protein [Ottowia sp.]|nr:universal stress protein [Ottowia sp.]
MKTLVAVDGSIYTRKMVDYITGHPELLASSTAMTVLTVMQELSPRAHAALGREEIEAHYERESTHILDAATARLSSVYKNLESRWQVGPEGRTIADFALQGGFDLIVLGAKGRSAVGKLIMGSTATKVMAYCEIPMLLVR